MAEKRRVGMKKKGETKNAGCKYCNGRYGALFQVGKSPAEWQQTDGAFIMQNPGDTPGIVLMQGNTACGYFDIKYCPFCSRKLQEGE
jgi:hypothetical protein